MEEPGQCSAAHVPAPLAAPLLPVPRSRSNSFAPRLLSSFPRAPAAASFTSSALPGFPFHPFPQASSPAPASAPPQVAANSCVLMPITCLPICLSAICGTGISLRLFSSLSWLFFKLTVLQSALEPFPKAAVVALVCCCGDYDVVCDVVCL